MFFYAFLLALLSFLRSLFSPPPGKIRIRSASLVTGNPPDDPHTNKITLR